MRLKTEKSNKPAKKKLPTWSKFLIVVTSLVAVLGVLWAVLTDVIVLRRTEDMIGAESSISILYVGNSQVFVGKLPRQLQTIARMHDVAITYKDISVHGNRGGSLSELKESAIGEIQSGRFDYVILYDHARQPHNNIDEFLSDIQLLCEVARENGVIPVLYNAAWATSNGQPDERRQSVSTEAYKRAADENDVILVNAGDAWAYAYKTIPDISLYTRFDPRGPHASSAGGFMTACVFAATLFDLRIDEIPRDSLYKGNDAIDLAQAAWEFVTIDKQLGVC